MFATRTSLPTRSARSVAITPSAVGYSTPQAEERCATTWPNNKGDRHGKFHYSTTLLTDIGEDLDALHEEFRPFRERFGVEVENRG